MLGAGGRGYIDLMLVSGEKVSLAEVVYGAARAWVTSYLWRCLGGGVEVTWIMLAVLLARRNLGLVPWYCGIGDERSPSFEELIAQRQENVSGSEVSVHRRVKTYRHIVIWRCQRGFRAVAWGR